MCHIFRKVSSGHPEYFICRIKDLDLDDSVKEHVGISKILIGLCTAFCAEHPVKRRAEAVRTALSVFMILFFLHFIILITS